VFICGMTLRCAGNLKKNRLESGAVTADLTISVVHNYKLLINDATVDDICKHVMKDISLKNKA